MNLRTLISSAALATLMSTTVQAQSSNHPATYNDGIGQIINENCVICHREGGIGPMQLQTYDQVRPWAPLIQYRVANRQMPPYAYDHGIGVQDLIGDWRMSQDDIDAIVAWVNQGAPLGDPDLEVPVPELPSLDDWRFAEQFGAPTLVVPSIPIDVPASGNDLWSKHLVPTGLTEDRCIRAVQVKPRGDAATVVHHANSSSRVVTDDGGLERVTEGMLTEYAMGKWGEVVPDDVCRILPANSLVSWDIHMFPGGLGATAPGTVIEDNVVEIGVWLHPVGYENEVPYFQDLKSYDIGVSRDDREAKLIIPANGHLMTQGFHSFDHPVRIDSFQPHGHLRMVAASLEVFYPETGRTEPISQISNWSATWHHSHLYEPDSAPLLPAGAVLIMKQWYDNTADNPNNPDPNQWVTGGSRTADEMTHAWIAVTHLDEAGYQRLLAERQSRQDQSVSAE